MVRTGADRDTRAIFAILEPFSVAFEPFSEGQRGHLGSDEKPDVVEEAQFLRLFKVVSEALGLSSTQ